MTVSHHTVERSQQDQISEDIQTPSSSDKSFDQTQLERLLLDAGTKIQQSLDAVTSSSITAPAKDLPLPSSMDRATANDRLLWAAEHGDLEVLLLALGNGADVNGKDAPHGKTALHWAAEMGHIDITAVLLARGGSVASTDVYGEIPMHYAADSGHMKIVASLLLSGSDPAAQDNRHRTALRCARDKDRIDAVRMLLPSWTGDEVDLGDVDLQHRTIAHWAAEMDHAICPYPAKGVSSSDVRGRFPLMYSLKQNRPFFDRMLRNA